MALDDIRVTDRVSVYLDVRTFVWGEGGPVENPRTAESRVFPSSMPSEGNVKSQKARARHSGRVTEAAAAAAAPVAAERAARAVFSRCASLLSDGRRARVRNETVAGARSSLRARRVCDDYYGGAGGDEDEDGRGYDEDGRGDRTDDDEDDNDDDDVGHRHRGGVPAGRRSQCLVSTEQLFLHKSFIWSIRLST